MNSENLNDKKPSSKKIFWILLIIIIVGLLGLMLNIGARGTQPIANKSVQAAFTWKSGALQVRGKIIPETCALTSKNCVCNLSAANTSCTFSFNFENLDHNAHIQANKTSDELSSIKTIKSDGCKDTDSSTIENCSITYEWDKTQTGSMTNQIELVGLDGRQSLVNLQINAN